MNMKVIHYKDKSGVSWSSLSPVTYIELLSNWDIAIVDLNKNRGIFIANNVRLRNCSLHYNDARSEYYLSFGNVNYSMDDIHIRR